MVALRLTQPPQRISLLRDGVPERLEAVLARGLTRIPADRFPTMREFRDALNGVASALG